MRIIPTVQVVIVLLGVASIVYPASKRNLQRLYMPTVAYLDAHTRAGGYSVREARSSTLG